MTVKQALETVLKDGGGAPAKSSAEAFAPSNIALCKYWGKSDKTLNTPQNSSLSISLGDRGSFCGLSVSDDNTDVVSVNHKRLSPNSPLPRRITEYLDHYRQIVKPVFFNINFDLNIPFSAGFASSACIFASLVLALDQLYGWGLSKKDLSVFARMGSGSACRSLWRGFVEWNKGADPLGLDSHGSPLDIVWDEFRVGLCVVSKIAKKTSSGDGMNRTTATSPFYSSWLEKAASDFEKIKAAVIDKDFESLGKLAESNATAMRATMLTAWPPLLYSNEESIKAMKKTWRLRESGAPVFFTQDAGPNLKILFRNKHKEQVLESFPDLYIVQPFQS